MIRSFPSEKFEKFREREVFSGNSGIKGKSGINRVNSSGGSPPLPTNIIFFKYPIIVQVRNYIQKLTTSLTPSLLNGYLTLPYHRAIMGHLGRVELLEVVELLEGKGILTSEDSQALGVFFKQITERQTSTEECVSDLKKEQARTREEVLAGQAKLSLDLAHAVSSVREDMSAALVEIRIESMKEVSDLKDQVAADKTQYSVDISKLKTANNIVSTVTSLVAGVVSYLASLWSR